MKQNRKKPTPVMNHRASCFKNHLAQAVVDQMQGSAKITWYFLSPNGLQFGRKTASLNSMGTHKSLQEFFSLLPPAGQRNTAGLVASMGRAGEQSPPVSSSRWAQCCIPTAQHCWLPPAPVTTGTGSHSATAVHITTIYSLAIEKSTCRFWAQRYSI